MTAQEEFYKAQDEEPHDVSIIAQDAQYAYYYAFEILQGRFVEGEAAIATSDYYSFHYALDVLKGRFPEGEKAIVIGQLLKYSTGYVRDYVIACNLNVSFEFTEREKKGT